MYTLHAGGADELLCIHCILGDGGSVTLYTLHGGIDQLLCIHCILGYRSVTLYAFYTKACLPSTQATSLSLFVLIIKSKLPNQAWWHRPLIQSIGEQRQADF